MRAEGPGAVRVKGEAAFREVGEAVARVEEAAASRPAEDSLAGEPSSPEGDGTAKETLRHVRQAATVALLSSCVATRRGGRGAGR